MNIELSYWGMFWLGLTIGCILCWRTPVLFNIKVRRYSDDQKEPNYIRPINFEYKTPDYFGINRPISRFEPFTCLSCLRTFARERGSNASHHCSDCIESGKYKPK